MLQQKIDGMLYERTALSKKPARLIQKELAALRTKDQVTPDLVFKDPYVLDFLGLRDTYSEKDLEAALLREIERFLLELGAGFAFLERQKRIVVDGEDFYLDLLFYHRRLRRLVLVELKLGTFQAADFGQMQLYCAGLQRLREPSARKAGLSQRNCPSFRERSFSHSAIFQVLDFNSQAVCHQFSGQVRPESHDWRPTFSNPNPTPNSHCSKCPYGSLALFETPDHALQLVENTLLTSLITQRPLVQIQPPQPIRSTTYDLMGRSGKLPKTPNKKNHGSGARRYRLEHISTTLLLLAASMKSRPVHRHSWSSGWGHDASVPAGPSSALRSRPTTSGMCGGTYGNRQPRNPGSILSLLVNQFAGVGRSCRHQAPILAPRTRDTPQGSIRRALLEHKRRGRSLAVGYGARGQLQTVNSAAYRRKGGDL